MILSRRKPGFTLIEVALASVLAVLLAAACFGVLTALTRTDRQLETRFREIAELERLHTVMQRTFMALVTTDQPAPRRLRAGDTPTDGAGAGAGNGTGDPASGGTNPPGGRTRPGPSRPDARDTTRGSGGVGANGQHGVESTSAPKPGDPNAAPTPAPRLLLMPDADAGGVPMQHPLARVQTESSTQRLELVLSTFPIATPARRSVAASTDDAGDDDHTRDVGLGGSAVRGAFMVRPTVGGDPRSWTLWWQPLRAPDGAVEADSRRVALAPAGSPVQIATDLAWVRWQVYDDRAYKADFAATWATDLPAYVEMEVITLGGLSGRWLFEVDWSVGGEGAPPTDDPAPASGDDGTNGAGDTGGDRTPKTGGAQ